MWNLPFVLIFMYNPTLNQGSMSVNLVPNQEHQRDCTIQGVRILWPAAVWAHVKPSNWLWVGSLNLYNCDWDVTFGKSFGLHQT